ncbi:MAG TPA: hypothetical protein VKV57_13360 [bacterium]|nr:hypothetical protein [bacterium]
MKRVPLVLTAVLLAGLLAAGPGLFRGGNVHAAGTTNAPVASAVIAELAQARVATAKYASGIERAKADGYTIITPMIPNMGYHFLNPKISSFDVSKPPILVYVRKGEDWQLVAIEWVWPKRPAAAPLQGATYGSFGAACHYTDGSFIAAYAEATCVKRHPKTGAEFSFWHPPLVTFHVWIWYPNPNGLFGEYNPLLTPFNNE